MKPGALVLVMAAVAALFALVALWFRERRARSVFPASQAASLLNPLRRRIQPPDRMVSQFGIRSGHRSLEIGPGPGFFTIEAARAVGPDGFVVCADLQIGMIEALRDRLPNQAAPRVRALVSDAVHLPVADACIDRAFLVAVLGEVPDPPRAVSELHRVLRRGGIVAFAETLTDPDYITQATLRRMAEDAGLRFLDRRRQPLGYIMRFVRAE